MNAPIILGARPNYEECPIIHAGAIVAQILNSKVVHVEAGIRLFDLTMPEEIDFYTTSDFSNENLRRAGIAEENICFVGNVNLLVQLN